MEKVVRYGLLINFLITIIITTACARSAPELPDAKRLEFLAQSSQHVNSDCPSILNKISDLESEKRQLEYIIESNRGRNQAAGYFGALFLFPIVAAENNSSEKERLDKIQNQLDELRAVGNNKFCFY